MKEVLRITIKDKERTLIMKDFKSYDFFEKPFLDLGKELNYELKENITFISKRVKKEMVDKIQNQELKYVFKLLLKNKHQFNLVNLQKFLNTLKNYNYGSFNKIYLWFDSFKNNLCNCESIEFERNQVVN